MCCGAGRLSAANAAAAAWWVQKEIRDIERDRASGVTIEVQGDSLQKLIGCLKGARH